MKLEALMRYRMQTFQQLLIDIHALPKAAPWVRGNSSPEETDSGWYLPRQEDSNDSHH